MLRSPRRRALRAGALLGVVLGTLAAAPVALASQSEQAGTRISAVRTPAGRVEFLFSASGVPAGATLDLSRVRVSLAGNPVEASARLADSTTSTTPLPPRIVDVVIDTSGSMAGDGLTAARRAAQDFARVLPPDVRLGLVTFADKAVVALAPTTDRSRFADALRRTTARGGTALYDAVADVATRVHTAAAAAGGSARAVVLSDGADSSSHLTLSGALAVLRRSHVPADVVAFRFSGNQAALRQIAAASGGRVLPAADARGLAAAFRAAARTLEQRIGVSARVPDALAGRQVLLEARVGAGAQTLVATAIVTLPAAPAADPAVSRPLASHLVPAVPSWLRWLVLGLAFAALCAVGALLFVFRRGADDRRRIAEVQRYRITPGAAPAEAPQGELRASVTRAALGWVDRLVTARGIKAAVALDLDRAGMSLRVQEWMLLRACGSAGLAAALALLTRSVLIGLPVGFVLCWFGTRAYLMVRASRRCAAFAAQLPDVLQLVAASLRSGFSLAQGLEAVVRDGNQPVAGEIGRALAEARLGVELETALDAAATRMRSRDLSWTVMAIRIQRDVGGNLAEVLLTTTQTMRERVQLRRQVRTLTAEGRLSAYILVALPIVVGCWMFLTRRDYMRPLYTEPFGIGMLVAAVALVAVGSFWLSRLVKVEV
jgi:Flp pilus assembly protein TadB/uncharacterized protein YegL